MRIGVTACLWVLCMVGSTVRAEAGPASSPSSSTFFPQGTLSISLEADYAHSFQLSPAQFEAGGVGIGCYLFDNFAFNFEIGTFAIQQKGADPILTEIDARIRHHLINIGKLSLFVDVGAGVSYANHRTPATGTQFDFTIQPGVGATWELAPHVFLMGGARFWHLSNARLEGPGRNPSINAIEGYLGLLFTL